jgi:hypothetical protein
MKYLSTMALAIAAVKAEMKEYDSLFRQFGNCMGADFGSTQACDNIERFDAQCCNFVVVDDPAITGQFCISNSQRETDFTGTYRDYDYTLWKWECKEPVNDGPNEKDSSAEAFELPVYSNYNDEAMEWILWIVYLSQTVYLLGLFISLPLGWGVLTWLQIVSIVQLFELFGGVGDFGLWFIGPFLSYWITQPFIFWTSIAFSFIPGLNILTAFLLGWWSVADYYQYYYELFAGPTLPIPAE